MSEIKLIRMFNILSLPIAVLFTWNSKTNLFIKLKGHNYVSALCSSNIKTSIDMIIVGGSIKNFNSENQTYCINTTAILSSFYPHYNLRCFDRNDFYISQTPLLLLYLWW